MLKNLFNQFRPLAADVPRPPAPVEAGAQSDDVARADALVDEGNLREDAGDALGAEALYREAVAAARGHARTHLNLGIVLAAKKDLDGAAAAYACVLALAPDHPFGNYNAARLALLRGDLARAETLIANAVRAKPDLSLRRTLRARMQASPLTDAARFTSALETAYREMWLEKTS